MKPLDPTLNATILSIAGNLFPDGFDVAPDAPSTYRALKAHLDAGKRLVVYDGGSESTIYVIPAVNHAFRAWHDFTHWKGEHDFSLRGETAVFAMQRQQLLYLYGDNDQTQRWIDILRAEVIGQHIFYERYKRFVDDQRGFIDAYLIDPEKTLSWSLW